MLPRPSRTELPTRGRIHLNPSLRPALAHRKRRAHGARSLERRVPTTNGASQPAYALRPVRTSAVRQYTVPHAMALTMVLNRGSCMYRDSTVPYVRRGTARYWHYMFYLRYQVFIMLMYTQTDMHVLRPTHSRLGFPTVLHAVTL